jgi:hypothetical protein
VANGLHQKPRRRRVHGQGQEIGRLVSKDILEHGVLANDALGVRLAHVGPEQLVGLGEAVLKDALGEVVPDPRLGAAAVARVLAHLLAQELLDQGAVGQAPAGGQVLVDDARRLEAPLQRAAVQGRERHVALSYELGPDAARLDGLLLALFRQVGIGPGYGPVAV